MNDAKAQTVSIGQQIDEVKRELNMRAQVYPTLISARRLKQAHAEFQVVRLRAVLRTLEFVRDNREAFIAACKADQEGADGTGHKS